MSALFFFFPPFFFSFLSHYLCSSFSIFFFSFNLFMHRFHSLSCSLVSCIIFFSFFYPPVFFCLVFHELFPSSSLVASSYLLFRSFIFFYPLVSSHSVFSHFLHLLSLPLVSAQLLHSFRYFFFSSFLVFFFFLSSFYYLKFRFFFLFFFTSFVSASFSLNLSLIFRPLVLLSLNIIFLSPVTPSRPSFSLSSFASPLYLPFHILL